MHFQNRRIIYECILCRDKKRKEITYESVQRDKEDAKIRKKSHYPFELNMNIYIAFYSSINVNKFHEYFEMVHVIQNVGKLFYAVYKN